MTTGSAVTAAPGVRAYPSNFAPGTAFAVTVTAIEDTTKLAVPVELVHSSNTSLNLARFALGGTVTVTIRVPDAGYLVSPRRYGIATTVDAARKTLKIQLSNDASSPYFRAPDGTIKLVVRSKDGSGPKLFLMIDRMVDEPVRDGVSVFDAVADFGVQTVATSNTDAINAAIQSLSDRHVPGGATLVFPAGLYATGTVSMQSDVTLYLTGGATLQRPSTTPLSQAMIRFDGVTNAHVRGPGVVNANLWHAAGDNIVLMENATDCSLQDVTMTGTGTWSIHILDCVGILGRNYKLINEPTENSDGTDPDHSRRVTIDDVFEFTKDDAFAIKTSESSPNPTDSIMVKNCVVWTEKSALKVGSEVRKPIRHVRFVNNQVIQADRGFAVYGNGSGMSGGLVEDVEFLDNAIEKIVDLTQGRLVEFQVQYFSNAAPYAPIQNIRVTRTFCYTRSPNLSTISGKSGTTISNVAFDGFWIDDARQMVTDAGGNVPHYFAIGGDANGIAFKQTQSITGVDEPVAAPAVDFRLDAPIPNPARGGGVIGWTLARAAHVELSLLDAAGREVAVLANAEYSPGTSRLEWDGRIDGRLAPAGIYFVRARTGQSTLVRRWTWLR